MTKNPDGSIVIAPDEVVGIDALITYVNRHVRDEGFYTSEDQTAFIRKWMSLKSGSE